MSPELENVAHIVHMHRLSYLCNKVYMTARNARYMHYLEPKVRVQLQYDRPEVRLKSPTLKIKITLDMHQKLQALQDITLKSLEVFKIRQPEVIQCEEGITMTYNWDKMVKDLLPVTLHFPPEHPFVVDDYN